jgi:DNA-binding XRE family transcriptional regulator
MMNRKSRHRFTSAALEHAYTKFIGDDAKQAAAFDEEVANAEIGRQIYDLRTRAGLTQEELAKLIGATASVVSRLEDADYEGHSLGMLRRIAKALHQRVEIRFVPLNDASPPA